MNEGRRARKRCLNFLPLPEQRKEKREEGVPLSLSFCFRSWWCCKTSFAFLSRIKEIKDFMKAKREREIGRWWCSSYFARMTFRDRQRWREKRGSASLERKGGKSRQVSPFLSPEIYCNKCVCFRKRNEERMVVVPSSSWRSLLLGILREVEEDFFFFPQFSTARTIIKLKRGYCHTPTT